MDTPKYRVKYVSWSEVYEAIGYLVDRLLNNSFKPDIIIAIAKGGLIPSRIVVDMLGIEEIGFIEVKFYKSIGVRGEKPYIKTMGVPPLSKKKILIVDDVVDSGRTMQLSIDVLATRAPSEIKSLVLYMKPWSTYTPDYYYKMVDEWIVFPWEVCESIKEGITIDNKEYAEESKYCVNK